MMDKKLKLEILEKMSGLMVAGFGLVAALAWNEAITKLFEVIFGKQSNLIAMFVYAILITVIVVVVTMKISKAVDKVKGELGEEETEEK
jgi:hypothetical protein